MENSSSGGGIVALLITLISIVIGVGLYFFTCYCLKVICEKCGHKPGVLIWIPIVQVIPLLTVTKLPLWFIVLFIIPFVSFFAGVYLLVKLCQARGKSGWLVLLAIIPIVFFPYLAFSE